MSPKMSLSAESALRSVPITVHARIAPALHRSVAQPSKQEDKPRRRFGQLRQRERLSLSNHTQRERIPSPTTHEAHEDAAVALNKLSTAVS